MPRDEADVGDVTLRDVNTLLERTDLSDWELMNEVLVVHVSRCCDDQIDRWAIASSLELVAAKIRERERVRVADKILEHWRCPTRPMMDELVRHISSVVRKGNL